MSFARHELYGLYEEEAHELWAAVNDLYFAWSMLRRVGVEQRRRFSEAGWAYGDPSFYGDGLLDVFRRAAKERTRHAGMGPRGGVLLPVPGRSAG